MMNDRQLSPLDKLMGAADDAIRTIFGPAPKPDRASPACEIDEAELNEADRRRAGQFMRVDHAGEVCAQALYQGQALTARLPTVREKMQQAAQEENDHLAWTEERIKELGTHKSLLNPFWYAGSFAIGAVAGAIGDKWSLGFVVETENQVMEHLDDHLRELAPEDNKSRVILEQMKEDEGRHATTALNAGAASFPKPIKRIMKLSSKLMTRAALYI